MRLRIMGMAGVCAAAIAFAGACEPADQAAEDVAANEAPAATHENGVARIEAADLPLPGEGAAPIEPRAPGEARPGGNGEAVDFDLPDLDEGALNNAARLASVLDDPRRNEDRLRDEWRHPAETLNFFGVTPDMTVVEVLPGSGWYTRVLAPYVAEAGGYIAVNYSLALLDQLFPDMVAERRARIEEWETSFPAEVADWTPPGFELEGVYRFDAIPAEAHGSADAVLFIRAFHNLARFDLMDDAIRDARDLLRPGGLVGVVQHRARADASDDYADGSHGYLRQADVIAAFEAEGFELVANTEINANPNDTADYEGGVWTLAPSLNGGEEYRAIGESDRMTLLFRRP